MSSINKAWAIVRGRLTGNREKAQGLLESIPANKRAEMARQEATTFKRRQTKHPYSYKLGEKIKRRKS